MNGSAIGARARRPQQGRSADFETRASNGSAGSIWRWTRQSGPVGPFADGSVHTDSTRPTTLARRPRPRERSSGRRSSERWIPTVCSNPKSALDVRRTPEPRISLASPICRLGHEHRNQLEKLAADQAARSRRCLLPARIAPPTHRSASGPSGLRHAQSRARTSAAPRSRPPEASETAFVRRSVRRGLRVGGR